ncbi:MAG: 2'-deoxycytidine 5'-triphosphate deaminase [Defluviicoccus sp.]|nr:2'-deoxycytidine 5'-triphosphate deaminase [Defluviicoccus sp.]MDE0384874.1 2'-deoxycytidine 5'-triphosphate deaminase [Defluviicoccus sp.]
MTSDSLFPSGGPSSPSGTGIFPSQTIEALIRDRTIASTSEFARDMIQPASLDLRLGPVAYRVQASFLPGPEATVEEKVEAFGMHEIGLEGGAVLERGCVYIVPLLEHLALDSPIAAFANPRSSTGRLDVFTRLITDRSNRFDAVARGYHGRLYAEVSPRTFSILVRTGSRLNQLRLHRGTPVVPTTRLRQLQRDVGLVDPEMEGSGRRDGGLPLRLDLEGDGSGSLIGFRAKQHTGIVDFDVVGGYDANDFWEPILARPGRGIILNPDDFYILSTREAITVPPDHAAEMIAYDTEVGEFRVHYAGFFDPGFGWDGAGGAGSRAVLEVRSHDVPFLLEHEQVIGGLRYLRLTDISDRIYGSSIGSAYQGQRLQLSKHFRTRP